jgi:cellulose synthase operon protein C
VETHLAARDWAGVEEAATRLLATEAARAPALGADLQRFKLGARFQRAIALMEAGRHEAAAPRFASVADEDPRHEFADEALFNAAACFQASRRFESALHAYERLVAGYPSSPLADEALFRVGWNAENAYAFDRAVESYLALVERYPSSKQRRNALYNAARALEALQRYPEAARELVRYAELFPAADDAAELHHRAAVLRRRAGDAKGEVAALEGFLKRFGDAASPELLARARLDLALAQERLGRREPSRRELAAAAAEFARRGLDPERHPRAAAAAAEARFRLAERELEAFERIALPATANPKKLEKALQAKLAETKRVGPLYNEVKRYKRPEWTLAAFYRQAYLLERLAQTLYEAPIPPELTRPGQEEYLAAYQDQLAGYAKPYEEQAVGIYVQALSAARQLKVTNEWTRRIAESLARHRPREYPVLRQARGRMALVELSPGPLLRSWASDEGDDGRGAAAEGTER